MPPEQVDTAGEPPRRRLRTATPLGQAYLLLDELGTGASGRVVLAWSRPQRRYYAAKVLWPHLSADPEVVARFVLERQVLTRLDSERLVRVHDLVVEGGTLAIVMDYVAGGTLADALKRAELPPDEALRVLASVAECLVLVHAAGIVHRDLKPANVLMDSATTPALPRLSDFGIARLVDSGNITRNSTFLGTPAYMAPEQLRLEPATPGVDVYALGVMAVELFTGRRPPRPSPHEPAPTEMPLLPTSVPPAVRTLVGQMTAAAPDDRPSAAEVVASLAGLALLRASPPLVAPGARTEPPSGGGSGSVVQTGPSGAFDPLATRLPGARAAAPEVDRRAQVPVGIGAPPRPAPHRPRSRLVLGGVVAAVVAGSLTSAGVLAAKRTAAARPPSSSTTSQPPATTTTLAPGLTADVSYDATHVPAPVLDAVGTSLPPSPVGGGGDPFLAISGTSATVPPVEGRPVLLFYGTDERAAGADEYIPWATVVALSRFGTLSGFRPISVPLVSVGPTSSKPAGSTATFTFSSALYVSRYISVRFAPASAPGGPTELRIVQKWDEVSVNGRASLMVPFVDVGGRYVWSPLVWATPGWDMWDTPFVDGLSALSLAHDLWDPHSNVGRVVDVDANYLAAAICAVDGEKPASVCTSHGVAAAAAVLRRLVPKNAP